MIGRMTTASSFRPAQRRRTTFRDWAMPGLVAGVAFLAIAMLTGAVTSTAWAMPDGIAKAVGVSAPGGYGLAAGPLLVGIAVHLTTSVLLGALFIAIVDRLRLRGRFVVAAAVVFSAVEPAIAIWVVLHTVLPHDAFRIFLTAIPVWASLLGHLGYGVVLGLPVRFGR
jgi:hypothetical protein